MVTAISTVIQTLNQHVPSMLRIDSLVECDWFAKYGNYISLLISMWLASCLIATAITTSVKLPVRKLSLTHCSSSCAIESVNMNCKDLIFNSTCSKDLLTRQRALCKSKRRGDNLRVIATRFTCQRALCNRGKRQGDIPRVIDTRFTCQRALCNRGKRQGDSQRVIATRFTCQRALCNRGKQQGDSQRVIDTDLVHGSSTWVQNRVQLRESSENLTRSYEKLLELMSNYDNLSETVKALCYVNELRLCSETHVDISDTAYDLGNIKSKVNRTCNLKIYENREEKPTSSSSDNNDAYVHSSTVTIQTKHINMPKSNAFNRSSSRSRCITRHSVHVNKRDREPSRIPMKKLIHLMSKNKKKRNKIKRFIRRLIPKSSALRNLLSTRYRKCFSQKLTNMNMWKFWNVRASKMQKCVKKGNLKITNGPIPELQSIMVV